MSDTEQTGQELKKAETQGSQTENKPPDLPWFIPDDPEHGVYRFIIAAAKRARQLQAGARPTISTTSRKPTRIAREEIRAGAIPVEILPSDQSGEEEEEPII